MRKLTIGAVALVALSLSACAAGGAAQSPTVTVTKTAEAPEPAPVPAPTTEPAPPVSDSDDQGYIDYLHSEQPSLRLVDDYTALKTGRAVCNALSVNTPVETLVAAAIDSGLTSGQTAAVIVGAVMFLCPQYAGDVQAQLNSY